MERQCSSGIWSLRVLASVGFLALACHAAAAPSPRGKLARHTYALPLIFERNEGQTDARVAYLSRGPGYNIFLTAKEAVLALPPASGRGQPSVVRMQLVGGNAKPGVRGLEAQRATVNYFRGSDASRWRTKVRTYQRVEYSAAYPGIDLVYYGQRQQLEYDFIVAPGADPGAIRITFAGVDRITLDDGDLVLTTGVGPLRFQKPVIYQLDGDRRHAVAGGYVLRGAQIGFRVDAFDRTRPLIIDPVLSYSTYLGGSGMEEGNAIAVDATGAVYVGGTTTSVDFPIANALQPTPRAEGFEDIYVAKFTPDGSALEYATFLGGSSDDLEPDIAVDSSGALYIGALSHSHDFPTVNALQPVSKADPNPGGTTDAVVVKLSPDGSKIIYSTFLGGTGTEETAPIAVDSAGAAYVAGTTYSEDFPLVHPLQTWPTPQNGGTQNVFVAKITPDGSALEYSTYLGGREVDSAFDIAVDAQGSAYVVGLTTSPDFPSVNPLQLQGGDWDGFVAKLAPDGASLVYSTYLGGSGYDEGFGIALDASGAAYVTGSTVSHDFPTTNAVQPQLCGVPQIQSFDAFVVKLAPAGNQMVYGTFLGGSGFERSYRIAVDGAGAAHVAGVTDSANFPTRNPLQAALAGAKDVYVSKLSPDGKTLVYSTYLGGTGEDGLRPAGDRNGLPAGMALTADQAGATYVIGYTQSSDFPTTMALQPAHAGGDGDAFVVKISDQNFLGQFNDLDGAFVQSNGEARRSEHPGVYTEDRHYLTTPLSDYLLSDWSYEVTVRSPSDGPPDILFIGVGSGRPDPSYYNEPGNSLELRIHQGWIDGRVDVAAHTTAPDFTYFAEQIGSLPSDGGRAFTEFTARIIKTGNTIKFSICRHAPDSAACEAEFGDEISDLAAAAPFLDSGNTYLFVGNGSASYVFTNASIDSRPSNADFGSSRQVSDSGDSSPTEARRQRGGGGAVDALLVVLLAQLALAAARRRRGLADEPH